MLHKLFRLCGLLLLAASFTWSTTLTGKLNGPNGVGLNGTLILSLSQQAALVSTGGCGGPAEIVPNYPVKITVTAGALVEPPAIFGNDCMLPGDLYYLVQVIDSNGNTLLQDRWVLTGSSVNIGTIISAVISGGQGTLGGIGLVMTTPVGSQTVNQPVATALTVNRLNASVSFTMPDGTICTSGGCVGFGLETALASSADAGLVGFLQSATYPAATVGVQLQQLNTQFINPQNSPYNAVCNGTTDDHTALQTALTAAAGKTLLVTANCGTTLRITMADNTTIMCLGGGGFTALSGWAETTAGGIITNFTGADNGGGTLTATVNVALDGCSFTSQNQAGQANVSYPFEFNGKAGNPLVGVRVLHTKVKGIYGGGGVCYDCTNVVVEDYDNDNEKTDGGLNNGAGLSLIGTQYFRVTDFAAHDFNAGACWHGLLINDGDRASMHGKVENWQIYNLTCPSTNAVTTEVNSAALYGQDISFVNGTVKNVTTGQAMRLDGKYTVTGLVSDATNSGIFSSPGDGAILDISISQAKISNTTNATYGGIWVVGAPSGSDRCSISDSSVTTSAAMGIACRQVFTADVHDNVVKSVQQEGIYVAIVTGRIAVHGNHVSDSGLGGAGVAGAAVVAASATIPISVTGNVVDFPAAGSKPGYGLQYTAGAANVFANNAIAAATTGVYFNGSSKSTLMWGGLTPSSTWAIINADCALDANHIGPVYVTDSNANTWGSNISASGADGVILGNCGVGGLTVMGK